MQEGQTIVRVQGVITTLRALHGEQRRRGRRMWGQAISESPNPNDTIHMVVDQGDDEIEQFVYEVPAETAKHLQIGQRVVIEIKMGATS
jgi:hypothetical protein